MSSSGFSKFLINLLVGSAWGRASSIMRVELVNAREEVETKAKNLGAGAAVMAVAGVLALFAILLFLGAAVIALAQVWPAWLAALAVGGAILLIALIMFLVGNAKVKKNKDLKPDRALRNIRSLLGR